MRFLYERLPPLFNMQTGHHTTIAIILQFYRTLCARHKPLSGFSQVSTAEGEC